MKKKQLKELLKGEAEFDMLGNDLFWDDYTHCYTDKGLEWFHIRWKGYNDDYWWNNVAEKNKRTKCIGDKGTVKFFELNYSTNEYVEVAE